MTSPVFSAVMCDGMGWFSPQDYKRMLLLFDKVYYLLPKRSVEFEDVGGRPGFVSFPVWNSRSPLFEPCAFEPNAAEHQLLHAAARADAHDPEFARAVDDVPTADRLYTWRVVNADGEIGGGRSPALAPASDALAHALLLNKFLLAADRLGSVPITGQAYVHGMIQQKYDRGVPYVSGSDATPLPAEIATRAQPVALQLSRVIVSDEDLARRSEDEIVAFKNQHLESFTRFHVALRAIARSIAAAPGTREFDAAVREVATLHAWKDAEDSRGELRSAWAGFFRKAVSDVAGTALTVGIAPGLVLFDLVRKSIPDFASSLGEAAGNRERRAGNGLYYLLRFSEQPVIRVRD